VNPKKEARHKRKDGSQDVKMSRKNPTPKNPED